MVREDIHGYLFVIEELIVKTNIVNFSVKLFVIEELIVETYIVNMLVNSLL